MEKERAEGLSEAPQARAKTVQRRRLQALFRALAIVGVVAIVLVIWLLRGRLPGPGAVTYSGIFLLSFFASASIVIPIPGIAGVCAGSALLGLTPLLLALLAATGEALGEATGYLVGYGGSGIVEGRPLYGRLKGWVRRRGGLVLFLFSVIPNPLFDIVGIAAGSLRYPLYLFFLITWAGKFLKDVGIAYACFFGLEGALRLLGVTS
ncbi:MAG: VTT domain-containing protein [Chloroflexi bacterium]|nr:VTT domain-containing protein [Chloroflexota bacterium]